MFFSANRRDALLNGGRFVFAKVPRSRVEHAT
jgi:hypothetical protein